uniref:Putative glycosyltransferase family 69 protein n=1 Tax=Moniliophthora roreri TaxID=221103 RepID=A0A0W0FJ17_MONRR
MTLSFRRRSFSRLFIIVGVVLFFRLTFFSSSATSSSHHQHHHHEIEEHNFIERNTRPDKTLNVQRHKFLQARIGRDERIEEDWLMGIVRGGMEDYWQRWQMPYINSPETSPTDTQHVLSAIDQLLSLNGWVAALCPTLTRPFGANKHSSDEAYDDLIRQDHLYYVAIVIHSADHFLVDQLAVIVQLAKRVGGKNLFVSMVDYDSSDSTETLTDLCEAVLTLLSVPFRIRRVPPMTADPSAAYYPLEEAYMRNFALEPLRELRDRRGVVFERVIWLKGFTCPNDILETVKVSMANDAAMVCGMDWAEHNGFFIFSDRWRTRDIEGDQFRQSKSSSQKDAVPPRDAVGAKRYSQHLPFQVFCCESGTHVVDPKQSYYQDIYYRAGEGYQNLSRADAVEEGAKKGEGECLDSSQAWFCRDLWVRTAKDGMEEDNRLGGGSADRRAKKKRDVEEDQEQEEETNLKLVEEAEEEQAVKAKAEVDDKAKREPPAGVDADANAGSDYDAISDEDGGGVVPEAQQYTPRVPNSVFRPAKILVNPRCPTTYAGVSHTQLALDLFGDGEDEGAKKGVRRYVLEDWEGAPDSFANWRKEGTQDAEEAGILNSRRDE